MVMLFHGHLQDKKVLKVQENQLLTQLKSQLMLQPHQQMETCMYDDNDDDDEHNEDEAAMAETEAQD